MNQATHPLKQIAGNFVTKLSTAARNLRFRVWARTGTRGTKNNAALRDFAAGFEERVDEGELERWFWADCREAQSESSHSSRLVHPYQGQKLYVEMVGQERAVVLLDAYGECIASLAPWQAASVCESLQRGEVFEARVFDGGREDGRRAPRIAILQLAHDRSPMPASMPAMGSAEAESGALRTVPVTGPNDSIAGYLKSTFSLDLSAHLLAAGQKERKSTQTAVSEESADKYADRLESTRQDRRR